MSQRPGLSLEKALWARGHVRVAGLDEAGRGAWAGPVVAAAVVLRSDLPSLCRLLAPVRDSKLLTPTSRERCYDLIVRHCLEYGVGFAPAAQVDRIGVVASTRKAMRLAIEALQSIPDYLLIDYIPLPELPIPQHALPKGERCCLSIAAASIIAKVTRDRWMIGLDRQLPGYGLARHKGYGTRQHLAALRALGTTRQHRHTFRPVRALDEAQDG